MSSFLIILIVIAVVIMIAVISANNQHKTNSAVMESRGYSRDLSIDTGKYISGHPQISNPIDETVIYLKDDQLEVFNAYSVVNGIKEGVIKSTLIKKIVVEDQSTIEKRITVARLLLVGIFAFALKKKKKNEIAYLIIEWDDGRFEHETIFEFEGSSAMTRANTSRNTLIRALT